MRRNTPESFLFGNRHFHYLHVFIVYLFLNEPDSNAIYSAKHYKVKFFVNSAHFLASFNLSIYYYT